jgi:hypothetical protein
MARVAIASLDGLACGEIDLAPCSRHCIPVCAEIVEAHRVYLSKEGSAYSKARRDHGEIPQSGARSAPRRIAVAGIRRAEAERRRPCAICHAWHKAAQASLIMHSSWTRAQDETINGVGGSSQLRRIHASRAEPGHGHLS